MAQQIDTHQQIERYLNSDRQYVDLFNKLKADDPYKASGLFLIRFYNENVNF